MNGLDRLHVLPPADTRVVVTGFRKAYADAIHTKRDSIEITDSIKPDGLRHREPGCPSQPRGGLWHVSYGDGATKCFTISGG